jgi:hypothetical protein
MNDSGFEPGNMTADVFGTRSPFFQGDGFDFALMILALLCI